MAGVIIVHRTLTFEVWDKSLRVLEPCLTPVVYSPVPLSNTDQVRTMMDLIIEIMNAGIKTMEFYQKQVPKKIG